MRVTRWNARRLMAAGLILVGLAGMIASGALLVRAVLLLPAAAGALLLLREWQHDNRERTDARVVRILTEYRHDWMNYIQLLHGYTKLGKIDKLLDFLDKINGKAYQESCVSKLGVPALIIFYYEFCAEDQPLELEFEFDREVYLSRLPLREGKVAGLIRSAVECFAECAVRQPDGETNRLSLAFDVEADALLLDFVYEGEILPALREELILIMETYAAEKPVLEQEWSEGGMTAAVRVPFRGQRNGQAGVETGELQ